MTDLIQEDLTTRGPGENTTLVDENTNEPIATLKKGPYGRGVRASLHPTFLAIHPEAKNSLDIQDIVNHYDSKSAALSRISHIHNHFIANGSMDHFKHTTVGEGNDAVVTTYHDRKTGEPVIKHTGAHQSYYGNTELHPDFIAKHNIPESVVKAKNAVLTEARRSAYHHMEFSDIAKKMTEDLSKPKNATATHSSTASTFHYAIHTSPEEASVAHEAHIKEKNPNFDITRISPTVFVGASGAHTIHSIAMGNTLIQTTHNSGSAKKAINSSF